MSARWVTGGIVMHRARQIFTAVVVLGTVLGLAACGSGGTGGGGTGGGSTITLQNVQFNPSTLTAQVGATVTIQNKDAMAHHIVIGTDDLGEQAPGASVTWTAPGDGVYVMKCLIHPSMSGQITVGAGGNKVGTPSAGGSGSGY